MGNRGLLHNAQQQILRPFRLKAWIICLLEFRNRKREVMAPDRYTELFFMDEATALAAGHRPCFECRRDDAKHFKSCWIQGNPEYDFDEKTPIAQIDEVLHKERISPAGQKILYKVSADDLPDGVFILHNDQPNLLWQKKLYPWSFAAYGKPVLIPRNDKVELITPVSTLNTIRGGYVPQHAYFAG